MANCNNCEPCESVYTNTGCPDSLPLDCTIYNGPDINVVNIKQSNKDTGVTAIQKLANAYEILSNASQNNSVASNNDVLSSDATDLASALILINEMKGVINSLQSKLRAAALLSTT